MKMRQNKNWTIHSWKNYPIKQQPKWPNEDELRCILTELSNLPALVFSGETRKLQNELSFVNMQRNFILQVGNCAELFSECNGQKIHNFLRIMLQMAMVIEYKTNKQVIKIGRIAGQYAKPRSKDTEEIKGKILPSYRGDIVNGFAPNLKIRTPDAKRLKEAYFRSAATLNLIRAFIQGGYNDIRNLDDWSQHFFSKEIVNTEYYRKLSDDITTSIENIKLGLNSKQEKSQVYISHEALLLDYEAVFTRFDTVRGGYYDTSAHLLWIGDRTREPNGAHIEFVRGIGNPVGLKVGPDYKVEDIIKIIKKINPQNLEGKVSLIVRFGYDKIETLFQPLLLAIEKHKLSVNLICDPMHGNTFEHNGVKVRSFDHIMMEMKSFFKICYGNNFVPGGIHLEITEENVTECVGGINNISLNDINKNYVSKVDPRLNAAQALELAFLVSELLNNR